MEIRMKKRKIRQDRPDTPVRHAGQEVSWFHDGTDQGDAARRAAAAAAGNYRTLVLTTDPNKNFRTYSTT